MIDNIESGENATKQSTEYHDSEPDIKIEDHRQSIKVNTNTTITTNYNTNIY